MSQPNPDHELKELRRSNARLLKTLLQKLDNSQEIYNTLANLNDRVLAIEALITGGIEQSRKRSKHPPAEPVNSVTQAKE